MDIGGIDLELKGKFSTKDIEVLLGKAVDLWPDCLVESCVNGKVGVVPIGEFATRLPCDFFLYKNQASFETWSRHGLTNEFENSMISVTVYRDCVLLVVGADAKKFGEDLLSTVKELQGG